jgi:hypothetical protein
MSIIEFSVHFVSENGFALNYPTTTVGIDDLRKVEEKIELLIVDLTVITACSTNLGKKDPWIDISLEMAQVAHVENYELFSGTNVVTVVVSRNYLNKFITKHYTIIRDKNNNVQSIDFYSCLNESAVIDDWQKKGFPLVIADVDPKDLSKSSVYDALMESVEEGKHLPFDLEEDWDYDCDNRIDNFKLINELLSELRSLAKIVSPKPIISKLSDVAVTQYNSLLGLFSNKTK